MQAWTSNDGPTSFEGRFFHHRNINIWPRPCQSPHPPIWVSTTSAGGAAQVGAHGYIQATFLTGFKGTPAIYDSYRKGWRDSGKGQDIPVNRLAYAAMVYVADNEAKARAGAEKLLWYVTANKVSPWFRNPPGYSPVAANVTMMLGDAAGGGFGNFGGNMNIDSAVANGTMFYGTPDKVFEQIKAFYHHVGGFGNLLLMGQAGHLDHEDTVAGIRTFAREVYPRLKEEFPDSAISGRTESGKRCRDAADPWQDRRQGEGETGP